MVSTSLSIEDLCPGKLVIARCWYCWYNWLGAPDILVTIFAVIKCVWFWWPFKGLFRAVEYVLDEFVVIPPPPTPPTTEEGEERTWPQLLSMFVFMTRFTDGESWDEIFEWFIISWLEIWTWFEVPCSVSFLLKACGNFLDGFLPQFSSSVISTSVARSLWIDVSTIVGTVTASSTGFCFSSERRLGLATNPTGYACCWCWKCWTSLNSSNTCP